MEKKEHKKDRANRFWFPLDNAAKIYPATLTHEVTTVFRFSVVLKNAVKIKPFFKAVALAEKRFPYYKVQLKKGFFWYYLEHIPLHFPVEVDDNRPCRRFPKNRLLIRILVLGKRISVECSHILTDGTGAFELLKTILTLYSEELGCEIPPGFNYFRPGDPILEEEYEDSYNRYFKEGVPSAVRKSKAFHLPWPLKSPPRFEVMNLIVSLNEIKNVASEKDVTITDYLVSTYLFALQAIYEELNTLSRYKRNKKIRIQVPVNLRRIFPSKTMRNFSLFVMPEIDLRLGHYTFDEIIKTVYHQVRLETDEKLINKIISRNVGSERKLYIRSIPLFLKSIILRMKYNSLGTSQYSGVITNLGKVKLAAEMEEIVDYFVFTPPPPNRILKVNCGVIGFNDKLVLSFGNITKSRVLEEKLLRLLKDQGIGAGIETNSSVSYETL